MELNADAVATHRANVGPCILSDITTASAPHAGDLIGGGVPCQSYSVAGNNKGLDDPRGQLFASLLRIGVEARARCILLENVRGIVSCGALPVILTAFRAAGYEPVHALLCAADYGVPQARVRLFIAGFRDAADLARFRWPAPSHGAPGNLYGLPRWRTVRDALKLGDGTFAHGLLPHADPRIPQGMRVIDVDRSAPTVGGSTAELLDCPIGSVTTAKYRRKVARALRGDVLDAPSPTIMATEWKSALSHGSRGGESGARRAGDRLIPALAVLMGTDPVRMTVEQLAALQSFPDDFEFTGTLTSQMKQVGNAVPPLLAEAVGRSIAAALYP
jgi:DNA (cytosine-5)-methyltransferase 1